MVLLFGLEGGLRRGLEDALARLDRPAKSQAYPAGAERLRQIEQCEAEMVFCSADWEAWRALLRLLRRHRPGLPVVVVSRFGETGDWVEALEAGAWDCCAPPFDAAELGGIFERARRLRPVAV